MTSLAAALVLTVTASAREAPLTRTVAVGARYAAGTLHGQMLGRSYRALWTTPISVEVLDLSIEAGGLTPVRRVGGQETRGLALRGADGRAYTFRSIDKEPWRLVPEELRGTFVTGLVQDQMAAQHPAAALVADELARAAHVPTVPIRFVVMPDDTALGEFRADFAGVVGTFSEFPTAATADRPGFDGSIEIVDHMTLYARLAGGPADRVAAREFLNARLFDLLISDFDRHRKQWRWARREGDSIWHPIPEDRDQAFARYEGMLVRAASGLAPQICSFGPKYDDIVRLTWNGHEQDRWLLSELPRDVWLETARQMQARITDQVIERAAQRMPPEWYAVDGGRLVVALKARRDALVSEADRFYHLLAADVDVQCTDGRELVRVRHRPHGEVEIEVSPLTPSDSSAVPYFARRFLPAETREVRLYLRAGDDRVESKGHSGPIRVRVIGGPGNDVVEDRGGGLRICDSEGANQVIAGPGTVWDRRHYTPSPGPESAPWIPPRDWGGNVGPVPWFALCSDLGVFAGGGISATRYGFRKEPFASRHTLRGGWAFGAAQPLVEYEGLFHHENSGAITRFRAVYSGIEVLTYHGFGNESRAAADEDSNEVRRRQLDLSVEFRVPMARRLELIVAPVMRYLENEQGGLLIDAEKPYGSGRFGEVGARATLRLNARLNPSTDGALGTEPPKTSAGAAIAPRDFSIEAATGIFPAIWDVESTYGWLEGRAATHLSAEPEGRARLALRVTAHRMIGHRYPYHAAASIGGSGLAPDENAVRGLPSRRFIGDSALYGNTELRFDLSRFAHALPVSSGLLIFGDLGRVWLAGEDSNVWHGSWGGGPWIGIPSRAHPITLTFARSEARTAYYLRTGFSF